MANKCFWGRSITASSGSSDPLRYKNFGPNTPGFPLVDYNDAGQIEDYLRNNPNCCAVMLEPIQGEGGLISAKDGYLKDVKKICEQY